MSDEGTTFLERLQSSPELRLIGRRIRLRFRDVNFEGCVTLVCRSTVVLLDVERMSIDHATRRDATDKYARRRQRFVRRALEDGDPASSVAVEIARFQFVTFIRKHISDVRLVDSRDRIATPELQSQLLRMHVKRFVILSTLGSLRFATLAEYLTSRSIEPHEIDLGSLEDEERQTVEQLADEVSKDRISRNEPSPPRDQPENTPANDGEEEDEGQVLLRLSGTYSRTLHVGIAHLILSIIVLLYAASVFSTANDAVSGPFASNVSSWVAGAGAGQLLNSGVVWLHALKMRIPLSRKLAVFRIASYAITFSLLIVASYAASNSGYNFEQPLNGATMSDQYRIQTLESPQVICSYAAQRHCSGWNRVCDASYSDPQYCPVGCTALSKYNSPCANQFYNDLRSIVLPVAVVQYLCCLVFLYDGFTIFHLFRTAYV